MLQSWGCKELDTTEQLNNHNGLSELLLRSKHLLGEKKVLDSDACKWHMLAVAAAGAGGVGTQIRVRDWPLLSKLM